MQDSFLFVSANSRLGLINPPYGEVYTNIGVELGAEYVLSREFLKKFPHKQQVFSFSSPELVDKEQYFQVLAHEYNDFIKLIKASYSPSQTLVTVGGDHSVSLGSLAAILATHQPETTALIMIDSHTDIHQPSSSPTGNFHGMWLRPCVDHFELPLIDELIANKLPVNNLLYIGNLDAEREELMFIQENKITTINQSDIQMDNYKNQLDKLLKNKKHLHISLDVDVFSHKYAPATGMEIDIGLTPEDIFPILRKLGSFQSISVDVVEVNPRMEGKEITVALAQNLIRTLFLKKKSGV